MTEEMSLEERKVIYRARRGLKEIDVYCTSGLHPSHHKPQA